MTTALAVVGWWAWPSALAAQELRGTVLAADGRTPAGGVVVVLVPETGDDSILARAVTNDRGAFSLRLPTANAGRLRVLRIGFQPIDAGTFALAPGAVVTKDVTLADNRIQLAAIAVKGAKRCDVRPNGSALIAQLFLQAKTALIATTARVFDSESRSQTTDFIRYENVGGKLTSPVERFTRTRTTTQAYASVPIDSLTKVGYIVPLSDGTMYYAPDADVLLSDAFVSQHCLQLVEGVDEQAGSVGIGFRPVNRPRAIVDITGTLWLDRKTYDLQYLEFTYEPSPVHSSRAGIGGRVEYTRMSDGSWIISRWSIRKPITYEQRHTMAETGILGTSKTVSLSGVQVNGGEVQSVREGNVVLFSNPSAAMAGAEHRDIVGTIAVTTGQVTEQSSLRTPEPKVCQGSGGEYSGFIRGTVTNSSRHPVDSAAVTAVWQDEFRISAGTAFDWKTRQIQTGSLANGVYVICNLPLNRAISLSATRNTSKSRAAIVKLANSALSADIDLKIDMPESRVADELSGTALTVTGGSIRVRSSVAAGATTSSGAAALPAGKMQAAPIADVRNAQLEITDASGLPIAYASVSVNGGYTRVTDEHGALRINNFSSDALNVLVRHIGFSSFQGKLARASSAEPFRLSLLQRAQSLQSVNVTERLSTGPLVHYGFYERMLEVQRGASPGEFFTPEDLEARQHGAFSSFLSASQYVKVTRYVPPNGASTVKRPEMILLGKLNCYMTILVDGVRLQQPGEPFGHGTGAPAVDDVVNGPSVMAVEVYPSVANAPMSIASKVLGSTCGIVAIWTGPR